jgi:hypothetical protein
MADPRFIGLVHSLLSSAQAATGERTSPMAHRLDAAGARTSRTARRSLALLRMLQEKTAGNLDETERAALHDALDALQRAGAAADDEPDAAGAAPDPDALN